MASPRRRSPEPQYFGYLIFHILLSPLLAVRGLLRAKRRDYSAHIFERLLGSGPPKQDIEVLIWAGYLGEARVARQLQEELASSGVDRSLIALATDSAYAAVPKGEAVATPFNNPVSCWCFLKRCRPQAVLAVGALDSCHFKTVARLFGAHIIIINTTILYDGPARNRPEWPMTLVDHYCVPDSRVAQTLQRLGVPKARILETGPFASVSPARTDRQVAQKSWRAKLGVQMDDVPIVIAASTHPRDEEVLVAAFEEFRRTHPHARLVLAPRNLRRAGGPTSTLDSMGQCCSRWSDGRPDSPIVLVDEYGLVREMLAAADLAYVGGTFDKGLGGHTPVEAIQWGVPVTLGPRFEQQAAYVSPLLEADAAIVVHDAQQLAEAWRYQLADPNIRHRVTNVVDALAKSQASKSVEVYRSLTGGR